MRRLRLSFQWLILLFMLSPAAGNQALADELPACDSAEFRAIYDQIAAAQLALTADLSSVDSLLAHAMATLETREQPGMDLPSCADAFAFQRLISELGGDAIGRAALDLAELNAADNPYRRHLPSDQQRIDGLVAKLLEADRSLAPTPATRRLNQCALEQLSALDDSLKQFMSLLALEAEHGADLVDAILRWREVYLPQLPACSDGIALALLLSQAATDAAAMRALDMLVEAMDNPYISPYAESLDQLADWQSRLKQLLESADRGATSTGRLAPCSLPELAHVYATLMPAYSQLLLQARQITEASQLPEYSRSYFDFRETGLSQLPACAEAFAAGWETRQLLGDLISSAASELVAWADHDALFADRLDERSASLAQRLDSMASQLEGISASGSAITLDSARPCDAPEVLFLQVYLLPELYDFAAAGLAIEQPADIIPLSRRSLDLRDLLWRELPRCDEALELGMVMRRIAADFIAMLWLEAAELPIDNIPQAQALAADLRWLPARAEGLGGRSSAARAARLSYVVSGTRGANIRACDSTDCEILATALTGEPIDVLDATGSWVQIRLPNDQVGYIASFLVSQASD